MPSGNQLQRREGAIQINVVYAERQKKNTQFDFLLGVLNRVGTVANVAADGEGIITADGACVFDA